MAATPATLAHLTAALADDTATVTFTATDWRGRRTRYTVTDVIADGTTGSGDTRYSGMDPDHGLVWFVAADVTSR